MDLQLADPVTEKLLKTDSTFRDLVHKHEGYEKRLVELARLTYPNDDEQQEEVLLKKKKLLIKDEIYEIIQKHETGH